MNKVFQKTQLIELCEEFFLVPDGFKGLVLTKEVIKTRKKLDKETRKPTGETETYNDIEQWFFPKLSQTLNKYLQLKTCEANSVQELLEVVLRVENKLSKDFA
jgi:hypothetical protein